MEELLRWEVGGQEMGEEEVGVGCDPCLLGVKLVYRTEGQA